VILQCKKKFSGYGDKVDVQDDLCRELWNCISVCHRYVENTVDFFSDTMYISFACM